MSLKHFFFSISLATIQGQDRNSVVLTWTISIAFQLVFPPSYYQILVYSELCHQNNLPSPMFSVPTQTGQIPFAIYSLGCPASMPFLMLFPLAGAPFPISACRTSPRHSLLAQVLHENLTTFLVISALSSLELYDISCPCSTNLDLITPSRVWASWRQHSAKQIIKIEVLLCTGGGKQTTPFSWKRVSREWKIKGTEKEMFGRRISSNRKELNQGKAFCSF